MKLAWIFVFALFGASSAFAQSDDCQTKCKVLTNDEVVVDLGTKCMCLPNHGCFLIDIGKNGPSMTTQGRGKITNDVKGAKFQSKPPGQANTGYDNDALKMNIPENDGVGKWIHKTGNCGPGGNQATLGCIGVPCDKWPEVKKNVDKDLSVCGGNAPVSRNGKAGEPGSSAGYPGSQR